MGIGKSIGTSNTVINKQSQSTLFNIPADLLTIIFRSLTPEELCNLRICCKLLVTKISQLNLLHFNIPSKWDHKLPKFQGTWIHKGKSQITLDIKKDKTFQIIVTVSLDSMKRFYTGRLKFIASNSVRLDEKATFSRYSKLEDEDIVFILKAKGKELDDLCKCGIVENDVIFQRVLQIDAQRNGYSYI